MAAASSHIAHRARTVRRPDVPLQRSTRPLKSAGRGSPTNACREPSSLHGVDGFDGFVEA